MTTFQFEKFFLLLGMIQIWIFSTSRFRNEIFIMKNRRTLKFHQHNRRTSKNKQQCRPLFRELASANKCMLFIRWLFYYSMVMLLRKPTGWMFGFALVILSRKPTGKTFGFALVILSRKPTGKMFNFALVILLGKRTR